MPAEIAGSILAIDLGLRRTGFARSDPGRTVAFGLSTFEVRPGRSIKAHLAALYREVPFTGVVLGLPFHVDGRPGTLAGRVERLGGWIAAQFGVPVAYLDERLTTFAAEELQADLHRSRRDKGLTDRLAAQVILCEFLASGCPFTRRGEPARESGM